MKTVTANFGQTEEAKARQAFPEYFYFFEMSVGHIIKLNKENLDFTQLYVEKTDKAEEFLISYSLDNHPDGWDKYEKDLSDKFPGAYPLDFVFITFEGTKSIDGKEWNIDAFRVTIG